MREPVTMTFWSPSVGGRAGWRRIELQVPASACSGVHGPARLGSWA